MKVLYFLHADLKTVPEMFGMIVFVLFFNNSQFGGFFVCLFAGETVC